MFLGFEFWQEMFEKYPTVMYIVGGLALAGFLALIIFSIIDDKKEKRK